MHEHELNAKLGLVGIPCYGTMNAKRVRRATRLGLVGIPCYGTIQADNEPALQLARACRNSLLWYNGSTAVITSPSARACRNSLLWYNLISERKDAAQLGLVGIPCYGTISYDLGFTLKLLGLVGIPCYGTMRLRA